MSLFEVIEQLIHTTNNICRYIRGLAVRFPFHKYIKYQLHIKGWKLPIAKYVRYGNSLLICKLKQRAELTGHFSDSNILAKSG